VWSLNPRFTHISIANAFWQDHGLYIQIFGQEKAFCADNQMFPRQLVACAKRMITIGIVM